MPPRKRQDVPEPKARVQPPRAKVTAKPKAKASPPSAKPKAAPKAKAVQKRPACAAAPKKEAGAPRVRNRKKKWEIRLEKQKELRKKLLALQRRKLQQALQEHRRRSEPAPVLKAQELRLHPAEPSKLPRVLKAPRILKAPRLQLLTELGPPSPLETQGQPSSATGSLKRPLSPQPLERRSSRGSGGSQSRDGRLPIEAAGATPEPFPASVEEPLASPPKEVVDVPDGGADEVLVEDGAEDGGILSDGEVVIEDSPPGRNAGPRRVKTPHKVEIKRAPSFALPASPVIVEDDDDRAQRRLAKRERNLRLLPSAASPSRRSAAVLEARRHKKEQLHSEQKLQLMRRQSGHKLLLARRKGAADDAKPLRREALRPFRPTKLQHTSRGMPLAPGWARRMAACRNREEESSSAVQVTRIRKARKRRRVRDAPAAAEAPLLSCDPWSMPALKGPGSEEEMDLAWEQELLEQAHAYEREVMGYPQATLQEEPEEEDSRCKWHPEERLALELTKLGNDFEEHGLEESGLEASFVPLPPRLPPAAWAPSGSLEEVLKPISTGLANCYGYAAQQAVLKNVAEALMNSWDLLIAGRRHHIVELEAYVRSAAHPDPYLRGDVGQLECGAWYFHRKGECYRTGAFRGLDIACGGGRGSGVHASLLLRSVLDAQAEDAEITEGPPMVVERILRLCDATSITRLVGGRTVGQLRAEGLEELRLDPAGTSRHLRCWSAPRVGLTLRQDQDAQAQHDFSSPSSSRAPPHAPGRPVAFCSRAYRFSTHPERLQKWRCGFAAALRANGAEAAEVSRHFSFPPKKLEQYLAAVDAGMSHSDPWRFLDKQISTQTELCEFVGACHSSLESA